MKFQNIQEFELYALMYVAGLDLKVTKEEMNFLRMNVSPETLERVSDIFNKDSDVEAIETIRQAGEVFLQTDEQKRAFFQKLRDMAAADYVVHVETANISLLEKLL